MAKLAVFDLDNTLLDRSGLFRRWAVDFVRARAFDPSMVDWLEAEDCDGLTPREALFRAAAERFQLALRLPNIHASEPRLAVTKVLRVPTHLRMRVIEAYVDDFDNPRFVFLGGAVAQSVEHVDPHPRVCVVRHRKQPLPHGIEVLLDVADAEVLDRDPPHTRTRAAGHFKKLWHFLDRSLRPRRRHLPPRLLRDVFVPAHSATSL
jgi:hypothetical protein